MKTTIETELKDYIKEGIKEMKTDDLLRKGQDLNEVHQALWLKQHNLSTFAAIEIVQEYERDNFGETNTDINSEAIVNMLAYIYGEEILAEFYSSGYLTEE